MRRRSSARTSSRCSLQKCSKYSMKLLLTAALFQPPARSLGARPPKVKISTFERYAVSLFSLQNRLYPAAITAMRLSTFDSPISFCNNITPEAIQLLAMPRWKQCHTSMQWNRFLPLGAPSCSSLRVKAPSRSHGAGISTRCEASMASSAAFLRLCQQQGFEGRGLGSKNNLSGNTKIHEKCRA